MLRRRLTDVMIQHSSKGKVAESVRRRLHILALPDASFDDLAPEIMMDFLGMAVPRECTHNQYNELREVQTY
jgi:hypothetical protein